jgi:hypothetical protein
MAEFHLAIVGGCMSHQHGTPYHSLYQRQLAAMLEADPGVRLRCHIVRDFEANLADRLDGLPAQPPMDGVLVHLRAAGIVAPVRLFRRAWGGGRFRSFLNPALFRRGHPGTALWAPPGGADRDAERLRSQDAYGDSPDLQDVAPRGLRIGRFRVRNLNVALGTLARLDGWAIDDELHRFDEFERACRERGLPFFVLGPAPTTYSYWTNRLVRKANAAIRRRLSGTGVPFALIEQSCDSNGRPLTRADGTHLTLEAHAFVAELLYSGGMREWVAGIVGAPIRS